MTNNEKQEFLKIIKKLTPAQKAEVKELMIKILYKS